MDHRTRILVVEPHRHYLAVLGRRLSAAGYRVTTSDCVTTALAELHRAPIDLVLAELNMPRIGGAELARAIRGEVQWKDMPIMLITGRSDPKGAVRAYEAGADDVILKPFHFEVLFARIERRIARVRSMQSLIADNATLDARIVQRALALGELKDQLAASEADRLRLAQMVETKASK